jgi:FtsP/CotA-like multicopper oxidase with cupredoxin domain
MSTGARIGLVVLGAVVVVAVFLLVRPSDEGPPPTPSMTEAPHQARTEAAQTEPKLEETPVTKIEVVGGEPKGGIAEIDVKKGEDVRIEVTADAPEEVHVHGYDISDEVGPDETARFDFPAELDGIYEIELEGSATQIAELKVSP